jgi:CheY-like chemotaxis protein
MKERARILVIDDSTTLRKLVEIAFRGTTAEVDFASSGADGIARALAHPPDVVLLDFMLPDMRGVDVCARLAESRATAAVPVVVMSAKREGLKEAFRAYPAAVDFLAKPFAMHEIRDRLAAAMRGPAPAVPLPAPASSSGPHAAPLTIPPPIGGAAGVAFSGDLARVPLLDALRFVSSLELTGRLTAQLPARLDIYVRGGDVVLCTPRAAPPEAELDGVESARAPRAAIDHAVRQQIETGKPAVVSLAEAGHASRELAPLVLRDGAAKLLAAALEVKEGSVAWRSLDVLPDWVEAYGRPLAVTGIALEWRRMAQASAAPPAGFLDAIYERTPRFSRKLAGARLSGSEQLLLSLFDGKTPIAALLERTGLTVEKAASVCNRLCAVDLLERRDDAVTGVFAGIALWNPDDHEFEQALRGLLRRRTPPIEIIDLGLEGDVAGAILRTRPRLILVTRPSSARTDLMVKAARSSSSALVAVLDTASRAAIDACLAAGYHAVLAKPLHINDLERLLPS